MKPLSFWAATGLFSVSLIFLWGIMTQESLAAEYPSKPGKICPVGQGLKESARQIFADLEIKESAISSKKSGEFPLAKGNWWIFEGKVRWTSASDDNPRKHPPATAFQANDPLSGDRVHEKNVRWKMEVTETLRRGHVFAAVLKGYPTDLIWYEEGRSRGDYLLLQVGYGSYFLFSGTMVKTILKRIEDKEESLFSLVSENDLILDLPLASGKVFGEFSQISRHDQKYFWIVEDAVTIDCSAIKGLSGAMKKAGHILSRTTSGDREVIKFVPGIGYTQFRFGHNGTVSEFDLILVEANIQNDD